jgi:hypothetical protein
MVEGLDCKHDRENGDEQRGLDATQAVTADSRTPS